MGNYIHDNRSALEKRHYIRKAGAQNYWFDFSSNQLQRYQEQYGSGFCMVIYGSEQVDDAYVLPFADVAFLFKQSLLDNRRRWIGNIRNNSIHLSPGGVSSP